MRVLLALALAAFPVLSLSCGDDNGAPAQQPGAVPVIPPSPVPVPSPSPSPSPLPTPSPTFTRGMPMEWSYLHQERDFDVAIPEACQPPFRFTIWSDGSYRAGPCSINDEPVFGELRLSELAELDRRATSVAVRNLEGPASCFRRDSVYSEIIDLGVPRDRAFRIFESDPEIACYLDGLDRVEHLRAYVEELRQRYYPVRDLAESPSPSPSVSPSPSPSPSLFPSVSPSPSP